MSPSSHCPDCGAPLPPSSPRNLCPRCLLRAGLDFDPPRLARKSGGYGATSAGTSGGILDSIAATIGPVPRIWLRDTDGGHEPPIHRPNKGDESGMPPRYRIDGVIARGGMGAVLKGRDPDLGRDVALKVLHDDLRDDPDMIRRFIEEAQIGGQLQHPGIVPIYELGTCGDQRPFFSMRLVKGQTFAVMLDERSSLADELPRFLSVFEGIAQTVAYAHARGVIHRDLKPSNVMVGAFGEVQVMDWGLAKVLPRGGVADDAQAGKPARQETVIATARSGPEGSDLSHAGSVMGTPAYMAPEQARGEIDHIDERADVFALGSILCEILTGKPAFVGRTGREIQRKTALGDLADANARLSTCGADTALVVLTRECLAPELEDRPRHAGQVAERVTAYLAGVQERLKASERDRAVAEARAVEERKQRRLQLGLAAAVLALVTSGGFGTTYYIQQRSERAARVARVMSQATTLRDVARGKPDDVAAWRMALAAARQAEDAAAGAPDARAEALALREDVQARTKAAERDQALLDLLVDIRSAEADDPDGSASDAAYAAAFHDAGCDPSSQPPAQAGARIKVRPPSVALALAAALDDWAAVRRDLRSDPTGAARLAEAARVADPDPWRNDLRSAFEIADKPKRKQSLEALAGTAKFDELGPISLSLLGSALAAAGDPAAAATLLRHAQERHPRDVWVNYNLGRVYAALNRRDDAIRFYTAARALRPETAHALADVLEAKGESDEAIEVFRELARLRPKDGRHLPCWGRALHDSGRTQEAAAVLEQAVAASRERIRIKPDASAHFTLGCALQAQGKLDLAIAEYHEVIRIKPDLAMPHYNLGIALGDQGKLDLAIAEYREAIQIEPNLAMPHYNLGNTLSSQGKPDLAIAEYREAIRIKPGLAEAHCNLGLLLGSQGDFTGSLAMLRRGHELGLNRPGWRYPSAKWVALAERKAALAERLPALLNGKDHPRDAAERLVFAQMCHDIKRHAAAFRLWSEALAADPKLGDDRQLQHRYNAARAAVLAAAGAGSDEPPPSKEAKTKLRAQAREWLKAELAAWSKLLESASAQDRTTIARKMNHWRVDSDLAAIREPSALAQLPEAEAKEWQALWAEVDALAKKAASKP